MRIQFVVDAINHLTGNTMRKAGDIMDLRDDYASALVSRGYAINMDATPEPEPELTPEPKPEPTVDWMSLHSNTIRQMARDAGVWERGMGRNEMIEALTDNA